MLEAFKGILVLLAGLGLLSLLHRDLPALAEELVGRGLLSHHHRLSGVLLRAVDDITRHGLWSLVLVSQAYSALRFIEAYGLWNQRKWGSFVAMISGAIYLPWEIAAVVHRATAVRVALVLFNCLLIAYLAKVRYTKEGPRSSHYLLGAK